MKRRGLNEPKLVVGDRPGDHDARHNNGERRAALSRSARG
jgi:hypothetical protein